MTVNATPSDSTATVVYRDADGETLDDADAGTTGHQVNVAVGTTIIEIVVTNASETLSYDVLVERDSAELYGWTPTRDVNTLLVLQRRFKGGCPVMRGGVSRESGWPARCDVGCPPAIAATHPARTVPGAASLAPPGTPAAS